MIDVKYQLRRDTKLDCNGCSYITYGIDVIGNHGKCVIQSLVDISTDFEKINANVNLFNELGLSLLHLSDVINDLL